MMTNRHDCAFPIHVEEMSTNFGLSKREYIASQILAGLISRGGGDMDIQPMIAVQMADALIDALNKSLQV